MSDVFRMHVFHSEQNLFDEIRGFFFGQTFLFRNEIEELATSKSEINKFGFILKKIEFALEEFLVEFFLNI